MRRHIGKFIGMTALLIGAAGVLEGETPALFVFSSALPGLALLLFSTRHVRASVPWLARVWDQRPDTWFVRSIGIWLGLVLVGGSIEELRARGGDFMRLAMLVGGLLLAGGLTGMTGRLAQILGLSDRFVRIAATLTMVALVAGAGYQETVEHAPVLAAYRAIRTSAQPSGGDTAVVGKAAVISVETQFGSLRETIDQRGLDQLPPERRAAHAGEVDTFIVLTWDESRVGSYGPPGARTGANAPGAFRRHCDVQVIDVNRRLMSGSHRIEGEAPPARTSGPGSRRGPWPTDAVYEYLRNLPMR